MQKPVKQSKTFTYAAESMGWPSDSTFLIKTLVAPGALSTTIALSVTETCVQAQWYSDEFAVRKIRSSPPSPHCLTSLDPHYALIKPRWKFNAEDHVLYYWTILEAIAMNSFCVNRACGSGRLL